MIALRRSMEVHPGWWTRAIRRIRALYGWTLYGYDITELTPIQKFIVNTQDTWEARRDVDAFLQRKGM